jgi:hypothetical protein
MATYVLPQVLVFQDLTTSPAVAANPLSAHISGGHAYLVRENESTEREFGNLGLYDNSSDEDYAWPNRPAGGVVDNSYTKLFVENALLRYFSDAVGSGTGMTITPHDHSIIKSSNLNFATGNGYSRDALLKDRDVQIGDVIRVRGVPTGPGASGDAVTVWTYVRGLIAEEIAGSVDEASADASNAPTSSAAASVSRTAGFANCVTVAADGSAYTGLAAGRPTETYVVKVLEGSTGGDFTTARLRVISASGTDDVASVIPAVGGDPTAIGTRGLTVTFDLTTGACSTASAAAGVSANDLLVGQEFTATVTQAFTATAAYEGGSYSLADDTTYIVTVTKGGLFAAGPQIMVSTTNGSDRSGPHTVSAVDTAIAIGTSGVTISFDDSTGLVKGDKFYVPVVGASKGAIRSIVLGQHLPSTYACATDEIAVDIFIRKPLLEVTANRQNQAPLTNWEQGETQLTVKAGVVAYDASWTDGGVAAPLPVFSAAELDYGKLYVQYRAWLPTLANQINSVDNVGSLDAAISGPLTPDNPLKWGVYKALSNNNGTPVLFTAVTNPDNVNAWGDVLEVLLSRDDAYGLVPLTRNPTVLGLFAAHVSNASSPTEGQWRVGWFNLAGVPEIPVVSAGSTVPNHLEATSTDGNVVLAVFEDDPMSSGSQYTIVRVPGNNSAFNANEVRAGDIVRGFYVGDGFGGFSYSEFVVDAVQSDNQLRLKAGPAAPQAVPVKIEVWRNLSRSEEAEEIGKSAASWGTRRIRATWPDQIESAGTVQEGYFLNAALAGLASAVLPQQGLTHVELAGFSSTTRTNRFTKGQLDSMAVKGVWIVQQQLNGAIYTRHAVTTGEYTDINVREEMITRNLDSISYRYKDYFAPYIGVTNVTPAMRDIIVGGLNKLIRTLKTERSTPQLGGQLIDATIDRFFVSELFKDRYVVYISNELPYALGNLETHLVV